MKLTAIFGLIVGLAVATLLIVHFGAAEIADALADVGWRGLALICAIQLALVVLLGFAWRSIVPKAACGLWSFAWGRLVRDSAAEVLPLSQLGGYVFGARAMVLRGLPGAQAAASTIVDITLEVIGQIAYTLLGLALLAHLAPETGLIGPILAGVAILAALVAVFVVVQRRGFSFVERALEKSVQRWIGLRIAEPGAMQAALQGIHRRTRSLILGVTAHFGAWILSAGAAWVALRLMGSQVGAGPVLAIESLLYAARSAAFLVPNAVGIQEGAYIVLGSAFGLPPDMMLALSLLKRARDIVLGVPTLLIWQAAEGGRAWTRAKSRRTAPARGDRP